MIRFSDPRALCSASRLRNSFTDSGAPDAERNKENLRERSGSIRDVLKSLAGGRNGKGCNSRVGPGMSDSEVSSVLTRLDASDLFLQKGGKERGLFPPCSFCLPETMHMC